MAADQRLKVSALHAVNSRKLVTAEFTAATRWSWNNLSIMCWLNRSSFWIRTWLIEARLTSLQYINISAWSWRYLIWCLLCMIYFYWSNQNLLFGCHCFTVYLFCRLLLKLLIRHNWTHQACRRYVPNRQTCLSVIGTIIIILAVIIISSCSSSSSTIKV